jgi:GT2 family glycosyltransferase
MTMACAKHTQRPTIGVLVLNRNGRQWLPTIYDSIRLNAYPNVRVYLVDNGSDDGSVEVTLEKYPEVTVLRLPQNLGYCMAYNLAMPSAFADGCDWVIWANNDIKMELGCLEQLALGSQSDPRIGVIGPAFLEWAGENPNHYMLGNHPALCSAMKSRSTEAIDVEWVEGSFLMVSRECVQSVGPLDPYLYFYWEEADFCRRARHRGWRVVLLPAALARHYGGASSEGNQQTRLVHLQSRNYYIYKLADPFQGFGKNLLDALHLLAVMLKRFITRQPSLALFHLRVFTGVLRHVSSIHAKWVRDRSGGHPPQLAEGHPPLKPEVMRSVEQEPRIACYPPSR